MVFFESFVKPPASPAKKNKHSSSDERRLSGDTSPTLRCDDSFSVACDPIHNNNNQGLANLTLPFDDDSKSFTDVEPKTTRSQSPSKQRRSVKKAVSTRNFISSGPSTSITRQASARVISSSTPNPFEVASPRAPPKSPLRALGRKLSWSNMETMDVPSVDMDLKFQVASPRAPPKSPLRTLGRKLSWSNMEAWNAPSVDMDLKDTLRKTDQVTIRRGKRRSPVKKSPVKINPKKKTSVDELKAPILDGDNGTTTKAEESKSNKPAEPQQERTVKKSTSLRNLGESVGRTLKKSASLKNVGTLVKKLSFRSLCAEKARDEEAEAAAAAGGRGEMKKQTSCSRFDTSMRRSNSMRSIKSPMRRAVSMRGFGGCLSDAAVVDTSSPTAAATARESIRASTRGRPQRQRSDRSVSLSPRRRTSMMQKFDSTVAIVQDPKQFSSGKDNNGPTTPLGGNRPGVSTLIRNNTTGSSVPLQITAPTTTNSPIRPRRDSFHKQTMDYGVGKQSSFVPSSPVRKATARKITSSDFASKAGVYKFNHDSMKLCDMSNSSGMTVLTTSSSQPMTERKKFTSVSDCIDEYSKIVSVDDPSVNESGW